MLRPSVSILIAFVGLASLARAQTPPADLIVVNAKVTTLDDARPQATAVVDGVAGGRITNRPVVRSARLSRSVIPSARVRFPGPLAMRGEAGTPRRRAITDNPSVGARARMSTQPGSPTGFVIALRQ